MGHASVYICFLFVFFSYLISCFLFFVFCFLFCVSYFLFLVSCFLFGFFFWLSLSHLCAREWGYILVVVIRIDFTVVLR